MKGAEGQLGEVERIFSALVEVLEKENPQRIRSPFQVSELYQSILPYRTHRRLLGFDTNQDYEMAVLRLLAGEGQYVTVEPEEVREQLAEEAQAINPNPGLFREYAAARVRLNPVAVKKLQRPDDAYAPPAAVPEPDDATEMSLQHTPPAPVRQPVFEPVEEEIHSDEAEEPFSTPSAKIEPEFKPVAERPVEEPTCPQCGERFPLGRDLVFCPFCGERVGTSECSSCGEAIEPGWRFCAACGTPDRSA